MQARFSVRFLCRRNPHFPVARWGSSAQMPDLEGTHARYVATLDLHISRKFFQCPGTP